ncbi:DedA family protein [Clostridium chromiireducens]|uniref:DedA family protein n=1 Tax=Clostridium chromiireducens TaxID=225345 RepID=A0A964RQM8_9CLOT|nr:DedA family protein [Clostridium chromiireducens]MVX66061.1 DedA family protein [Clostridium chromiireducens]
MEIINSLTDYIMYIISEIGYIAVVIITAMEYACFPAMPSEVILPAIGILAAKGEITYFGALISSVLGGLIGSLLCYYVGYYGGGVLIEKIILKFPKTKRSIEIINIWFEKHGKLAIFFTRLIPLTRTYISIISGTAKYNKKTFILFSVMGIIIWNAILVSLGYFIGHNWSYIHLIMKQYSIFAAIIIFIIILLLMYRKLVNRKQNDKSKNLI